MDGPLLPALNADEFLSWEARQFQKHELIDGFVFAYGSRSLDHSVIAVNLVGALQRAFPAPCRTFNSDVFVRAAEAVLFYPDASVVCGDVDMSARYIDAPLVVAEVLSASTRSYDLLEKRSAYRRISSLEYCVIVHTAVRRVEIDRRVCRSNWVSQSYESGELLLSVDEIYAGSSLLK